MAFQVFFPQQVLFSFGESLSELAYFLFLFSPNLRGALSKPFVSWLEAGGRIFSANSANFVSQQTRDY